MIWKRSKAGKPQRLINAPERLSCCERRGALDADDRFRLKDSAELRVKRSGVEFAEGEIRRIWKIDDHCIKLEVSLDRIVQPGERIGILDMELR